MLWEKGNKGLVKNQLNIQVTFKMTYVIMHIDSSRLHGAARAH